MGKSDLSPSFFARSCLFLTGIFPASKPSDYSSAILSPWFDDFGSVRLHDLRVLLPLFRHTDSGDMDLVEMFPMEAVMCIAWGTFPYFL